MKNCWIQKKEEKQKTQIIEELVDHIMGMYDRAKNDTDSLTFDELGLLMAMGLVKLKIDLKDGLPPLVFACPYIGEMDFDTDE